MSTRAFTLREGFVTEADYEGLDPEQQVEVQRVFAGASFTHGPTGRTVDVAALLAAGDGTIVTSDGLLADGLEGISALKHVAAPDDATPIALDREGKVVGVVVEDGEPVIDESLVDVDPDAHTKADLLKLADGEEGVEDAQVNEEMTKREIADVINGARATRREGSDA